jgi:prolyl-tRNA synthetase
MSYRLLSYCLTFKHYAGAKYFEWERKGVPLRLEVGPRDAKVTVYFN